MSKVETHGEERSRAIRESDFIINECLYIKGENIDVNSLEFQMEGRFIKGSFIKTFKRRLELFMLKDTGIKYDKDKGIITYNKQEVEKK